MSPDPAEGLTEILATPSSPTCKVEHEQCWVEKGYTHSLSRNFVLSVSVKLKLPVHVVLDVFLPKQFVFSPVNTFGFFNVTCLLWILSAEDKWLCILLYTGVPRTQMVLHIGMHHFANRLYTYKVSLLVSFLFMNDGLFILLRNVIFVERLVKSVNEATNFL